MAQNNLLAPRPTMPDPATGAPIGVGLSELFRRSYASNTGPMGLDVHRRAAEKRFPYIRKFRNVGLRLAKPGTNKGGMGEYYGKIDSPTGKPMITIGENSAKVLSGGIADTIIADMVHAAAEQDPQFQALKRELRSSLSPEEVAFSKRIFEQRYKGKLSGERFNNFDKFLYEFVLDGVVQQMLLPQNADDMGLPGDDSARINNFRRNNPKAVPVLGKIERLFLGNGEGL